MTPRTVPGRLDLDRVCPDPVPERVKALVDRDGGGLPVGSPGKVGVLDLGFRSVGGTTVLHRRFQKSPLQVIRAHHLDPALPGVPVIQVASTGGGIVGGDRLRVDVEMEEGAHAIVTTQSATRIHRADRGYASQVASLRVGAGAVCEWIPDVSIPYSGSRFVQRIDAVVEESAVLAVADVVTSGREGRDPEWSAETYDATVEIRRPDGVLCAIDRAFFGTALGSCRRVMPPDVRSVGTLLVVAPVEASSLVASLRGALDGCIGTGVSALPAGSGAWVRVVGDDPWTVRGSVLRAWSAAREVYVGHPAPDLRNS